MQNSLPSGLASTVHGDVALSDVGVHGPEPGDPCELLLVIIWGEVDVEAVLGHLGVTA